MTKKRKEEKTILLKEFLKGKKKADIKENYKKLIADVTKAEIEEVNIDSVKKVLETLPEFEKLLIELKYGVIYDLKEPLKISDVSRIIKSYPVYTKGYVVRGLILMRHPVRFRNLKFSQSSEGK